MRYFAKLRRLSVSLAFNNDDDDYDSSKSLSGPSMKLNDQADG